ncbi:chromatin-modulating protein mrc1 [Mactra antiquata]
MMCADDGVICIKEVCGPAPTIEYAIKTGNLRSIGSQVVYLCMYGSTMRVVSRCKADATWSPVALYCPPPPTTLEPTTTVDPSSETWFLCEDILFAITEIKYTWYEGKIHCQSFGGRFAEVTSLSIGTCLADTYEADYRSNTLWIGASDLDSDGVLEWTTGNEADSQGFGLSNSVEGKCIFLDTASREWKVDGCDVDNKVVCQR